MLIILTLQHIGNNKGEIIGSDGLF
jgi:hypothetical protein